jgi:hypothetical protein
LRAPQPELPSYTRPLRTDLETQRREVQPRGQLPAVYSKASLQNEGSTGATSLPSAAPAPHRRQDGDRHQADRGPSLVDRYLAGVRMAGGERRPDKETRRGGQSSLAAAQALYGGARLLPGRGNLPQAVAQLIGVPSALPALYARQLPRQPRRLPGLPGL